MDDFFPFTHPNMVSVSSAIEPNKFNVEFTDGRRRTYYGDGIAVHPQEAPVLTRKPAKIDWTAPLAFTRAQSPTYVPRYLGNFPEHDTSENRHVVVSRNWLNTEGRYGYIVYNDYGDVVGTADTGSSGILSSKIINVPETIIVDDKTASGLPIKVTYTNGVPTGVELS